MRNTLILNDGTRLVVSYCGANAGYLWIDVYEKSFYECAYLFSNQKLTSRMVYEFGEMHQEYEGYTELTVVMAEDDYVKVALKRGGG